MGKKIGKAHFMVGLAACGAALLVLSIPVGLIELIVTSTGLSESFPAAAPPLGLTARLLLAGFAAVMAAGGTLAFNTKNPAGSANGEKIMGFALSKLTAFARGRGRGGADDLPVLRRADAHPDAPARRPIFASRDFQGVEIFKPVGLSLPVSPKVALPDNVTPLFVEEERDPIIDGAGLALPHAPDPLSDAVMIALAMPRALERAPETQVEIMPVASPVAETAPKPAQSASDASIADLAARFERGLARRVALAEAATATDRARSMLADAASVDGARVPVLADIPAAAPVPVRADVDVEINDALRAALGTLQRMTARAG